MLIGPGECFSTCDCGQPCIICVCHVTGDIFWRCSEGTCFFLQFCTKLSNLTAMDVGQLMPMGWCSIDRYTTLTFVMRWLGHSFGKTFWYDLAKRPTDADFPHGSYQMDPGERYDSFISYRGSTGRPLLYMTLCGYYNIPPAFYFMYIVCPVMVGLMNLIPEACRWTDNIISTWGWLLYRDDICSLAPESRTWFVFRAYVAPLVMLTILFWNPVFSFAARTKRFFFDKFCIHQSDSYQRLPYGIRRLPLYCQKSKELHCLFDLVYASRLWCIFELAVFLRTHKNPRVVFTSISQRVVEVIVIFLVIVGRLIVDVTDMLASSDLRLNDDGQTRIGTDNDPVAGNGIRYVEEKFGKYFGCLHQPWGRLR